MTHEKRHRSSRLRARTLSTGASPHNRSWVSNSGNDTNTRGTISSPCKTFQKAHDNTVAGGEVDVLNAGDYGTLAISKSITIDGGNLGHILALATNGITINTLWGNTTNGSFTSTGGIF
jgi:hypothetical protein